jgi:hypothetical protein
VGVYLVSVIAELGSWIYLFLLEDASSAMIAVRNRSIERKLRKYPILDANPSVALKYVINPVTVERKSLEQTQ